MKHSVKVWMALDRDGMFLCRGNPNKFYSYHIGVLEANPNDAFVRKWTREEIREDCRIWNDEVRRNARSKTAMRNIVKPVRVEITFEEVK